jgi:hypothetical protein
MSNPKQDFAVGIANGYKSLAATLFDAYQQAVKLQGEAGKEGVSSLLQNFATQAVNADGSLGAADGAPNTAHPMALLGFSWSGFNGVDNLLTNFIKLMTNQAAGPLDGLMYCDDIMGGK